MNNDQLSHKQLNDLFEALEKDDIAGSVGLIEQIGDAKNALALEPLLVLLGFHDERVRGSSATALGKLGMGPAVEPLIKALTDPSVSVQEKAAIALGIIGDGRATGPLENVSPDHYRVKRAAEYSLLQIESKNKKESLFKNNVAGGRPVIISPLRPVAPDGGHAYSPKPVELPVKKTVTPPPDVSTSTAGKPVAEPGMVSDGEAEELPPKNPMLAGIASLIIPGVGQLYNGESLVKALLHIFGCIIGNILIIPGLIVRFYSSYEAYKTAKKINEGLLPNRKPNMLMILFIAPFVLVIMFAMTLLLAAVIAAFVFQMGSSMPDDYHVPPSVTMSRIDLNTIKITNLGGGDASLTGLQVMVNGTEIRPVSGRLTPEDGSSGTYAVKYGPPVTIVADFNGLKQDIYSMRV